MRTEIVGKTLFTFQSNMGLSCGVFAPWTFQNFPLLLCHSLCSLLLFNFSSFSILFLRIFLCPMPCFMFFFVLLAPGLSFVCSLHLYLFQCALCSFVPSRITSNTSSNISVDPNSCFVSWLLTAGRNFFFQKSILQSCLNRIVVIPILYRQDSEIY